MKTADFDFALPADRIALRPHEQRDGSRLLVLSRQGGMEHRRFSDFADYLEAGDMLILNNTRVFPARLIARKPTGGGLDLLFVKETGDEGVWEVLARSSYEGAVHLPGGHAADLFSQGAVGGEGTRRVISVHGLDHNGVRELLWRHGLMPLPPYIKRKPDVEDRERYQTVFAEQTGSIAAPTAGLHFTGQLLDAVSAKGVAIGYLTLHVGIGTFRPIKAEAVADHAMDREYFEIPSSLLTSALTTRQTGKRVITVGTTATRALEGYSSGNCSLSVSAIPDVIRGSTDIFIHPGYSFRAVDGLVTNFHLPRSTPLMLAAAFAGFGNLMAAYREAIARDYRFFSYGDAMLIV
jgi:S-adenosylmethionine:tRNA ribosyltransferase-isomerase